MTEGDSPGCRAFEAVCSTFVVVEVGSSSKLYPGAAVDLGEAGVPPLKIA